METSKGQAHIRLDSALRGWGFASKRETRALISAGRITVNGIPAGSASMYIKPTDLIAVDGISVRIRPSITLMMNKPAGYVCVSGSSLYPSVFSLLSGDEAGSALFSIGRLDADTEGLLLLTNSGELCEKISRPEREIQKTYYVTLDRPLCPDAEAILSAGVTLNGGAVCRPARIARLSDSSALITVTEGKYHEVKRLVRACGARVAMLRRISIGGLSLDPELAPGQYRLITEGEISKVFEN